MLFDSYRAPLSGAVPLIAFTSAVPSAALTKFDIRYESETPGMQNTTATFSVGGVETFNTRGTGNSVSFTTDFGTGGTITGDYGMSRSTTPTNMAPRPVLACIRWRFATRPTA